MVSDGSRNAVWAQVPYAYSLDMPFHASAVSVLVASPGDTVDARNAILRETARWNGRYAAGRGFVLCPWLYELHATPQLGDRPQAIINRQGVDKADVVVAVFGHRLGTPTSIDISGTVEEINRASELGKPVHVYFSTRQLPNDVDTNQLGALRAFKTDLEDRGLCGRYDDPEDLARQVRDALEYDLDGLETVPVPGPASGVRLEVHHDHQTEPKTDSKGRITTRHVVRDLVIQNRGDATAENLRFQPTLLDDDDNLHFEGIADDGWSKPIDLTPGSSIAQTCFPMRGRANVRIDIKWEEGDHPHERSWTTQVT